MKNNCIQIKQLSKRYDSANEDSLSNINLDILSADKYGILGPNGAGKTTLISIICGIFSESSGQVKYWDEGTNVSFKDIQAKIGYVPQEYALYQELSPIQNLEYFGALYNLSKTVIAERTKEILEVLGLSHVANKKVQTFSGGMKRRINIALGIIHNPSILFLDEPTVGVDVQSKVAILKFLNELNAKGTTIVYTSHHLSEAQEFCNRIALLDQGQVILEGEMSSLLEEHQTNDLKSLFIQFTGEEYRD